MVQHSRPEVELAADRGVTGRSRNIVSLSSGIVDLIPIPVYYSSPVSHSEYDSRQQVVHDPLSEQFLAEDGEDSHVLNVLATDTRSTGG